MTSVSPESGGNENQEKQLHARTPAEYFGDLVMSAEFRLIEATENSKQPPMLGWVRKEIDPVSHRQIGWFRIGSSQQLLNANQDLVDVGMPLRDTTEPLTEENLEKMLVGSTQRDDFLLVRDPRDVDGPYYRLTEADAMGMTSDEQAIDERQILRHLLEKLSSDTYFVHPISVRVSSTIPGDQSKP